MKVTLTWSEANQGALAGVHRRLRAVKLGRQHPAGDQRALYWNDDIEGALAEMAVAKALGRYWSDTSGLDIDGDVESFQVRSSTHPSAHLLLYDRDSDGARFVLVTGSVPVYEVRGWIDAVHGKRAEFYRTTGERPAYWVPQAQLNSMEEI